MEPRDVFLAAASLAAILFLLLIAVFAAAAIFSLGSPLVLLGSILAMGLAGIVLLIGLAGVLISVLYVVYAFLNERFCEKKAEAPMKRDYTLGRIRKSP